MASDGYLESILNQPSANVCFVVMPFAAHFDERFHEVYVPAIQRAKLTPVRADSLFRPAPIVEDIWRLVRRSSVLLADLTDTNPNVFYELGLAHATCKPVVLLAEKIEHAPFDLRAMRLLLYDTKEANWKTTLRDTLALALSETVIDPDSAIPAIYLEPPRGFDIRYRFGGRRVPDAFLDKVQTKLGGLLGEQVPDEAFAELTAPQLSKRFLKDVKGTLARIGRNFPDALLAEIIWSVSRDEAHIAVGLLVETGFARDFTEANLIYELVEWAYRSVPDPPRG